MLDSDIDNHAGASGPEIANNLNPRDEADRSSRTNFARRKAS
jgi:hypothetical protein